MNLRELIKSPTTAWFLVHVMLPLMPFWLGSLARAIVSASSGWETFDASDLAISLALVALFVNQSLIRNPRLLDDPDKKDEVAAWAVAFLIAFAVLATLFILTVVFRAQADDLAQPNRLRTLHTAEGIVFAAFPVTLFLTIAAQRTFELRATIA